MLIQKPALDLSSSKLRMIRRHRRESEDIGKEDVGEIEDDEKGLLRPTVPVPNKWSDYYEDLLLEGFNVLLMLRDPCQLLVLHSCQL
jgi:hypothetical protein